MLPILFFSGKMWKRFAVLTFFLILMACADSIGSGLVKIVFGDANLIFTETAPMLMHCGLSLPMYILFGSVAVLAWRTIAARKFQSFFLLFFIMPMGQLLTVLSITFSAFSTVWVWGVFVSMIGSLILLVYTISQERKTALEEELQETRHAMDLEQSHYREIELRREALANIRHDFNNQLASIGQLIRAGEKESAQDMINALSHEIAGTREKSYCSIPVVNAILAEKALACAKAGIRLSVDLDFPASLTVEQMHICGIFGNLLDNAINACKHADTPTIELKSMVDGGYLFIKTVNPSGEPPKKAWAGRGFGSRILSDYAVRYGGDYKTEYKDGVFTALVSLLAVRGA